MDYTSNAVKGQSDFDFGDDAAVTFDDQLSSLGFIIVNVCVVSILWHCVGEQFRQRIPFLFNPRSLGRAVFV